MLELSVRNNIIVCPDCGQRYDPAKAAKVARAWRESTRRTVKPRPVEAQDVREPGHRNGRHHRAHRMVTARALDGRALVTEEIAEIAFEYRVRHGAPEDDVRCEHVMIDGHTVLWFASLDELESVAVEIEDPQLRVLCERIIRAAQAVRVDHPWWRAYLHELGVSPDVIALGLTIGNADRGDVLFERRVPQVGQTLPGVL